MTPSETAHLHKIQSLILRLAEGEYAAREEVSSELSDFDTIINSLNILGEELTELSDKNKQMDVFFYKISHDMISSVNNTGVLLEMGTKELNASGYKGPAMDFFRMAIKANFQLRQLIDGITELVKFSAPNLQMEEINFDQMIKVLVKELNQNHDASGFNIRFLSKLSSAFTSYPVVLNSIFKNIIENAWKYRNQQVQSFLEIRITPVDDGIVIECEDNGMGMSPEFQKRAFEFFQRENSSIPGTGLGLYIIKNTIEKNLKGKIELMSRQGAGTTFTLFLPSLGLEN